MREPPGFWNYLHTGIVSCFSVPGKTAEETGGEKLPPFAFCAAESTSFIIFRQNSEAGSYPSRITARKQEVLELFLIRFPNLCGYVIVWRCDNSPIFQYHHHMVHIFIYINHFYIKSGKITSIIE